MRRESVWQGWACEPGRLWTNQTRPFRASAAGTKLHHLTRTRGQEVNDRLNLVLTLTLHHMAVRGSVKRALSHAASSESVGLAAAAQICVWSVVQSRSALRWCYCFAKAQLELDLGHHDVVQGERRVIWLSYSTSVFRKNQACQGKVPAHSDLLMSINDPLGAFAAKAW